MGNLFPSLSKRLVSELVLLEILLNILLSLPTTPQKLDNRAPFLNIHMPLASPMHACLLLLHLLPTLLITLLTTLLTAMTFDAFLNLLIIMVTRTPPARKLCSKLLTTPPLGINKVG